MQRRIYLPAVLFGYFSLCAPCLAQGGPDPKIFAAAANKQLGNELKANYGFSDAQVRDYFAKREAIFASWRTSLDNSRKKMLATKEPNEKKRIIKMMQGSVQKRDIAVRKALLQTATAEQRSRIK